MSSFVHLHLHSQYSLLDGANRLDDVLDAAVEAGMPAIALTDHGNMFGAIEFYTRARARDIKPVVGIEAYVAPGERGDRTKGRPRANHLVLLARNEAGFRNLVRLTSRAYLEGFYYHPRVDKDLLREHSEGITCLSACLKGEINEKILAGRVAEAEAAALEFREIFGRENFYLELQDHGIEAQSEANEVLRRMSSRTGIPLVVSNDTHYLRQDDSFAHDVLLCIGTQRVLSDQDRLRYASDQFYLKSAEEMIARFPGDRAAIENTLAIAERCDLQLPRGKFHLPQFPVPDGYTLDSYFAKVAREGLEGRLKQLRRGSSSGSREISSDTYHERLESEIRVIQEMGFPGYFLIVWDFIRYARQLAIPVGPGRGSAAGSLVAYALRITDIDPLQYDLIFERFLNPERVSLPDIDIDFCMRRRGEVIQYVSDKYGRDHVAQIITFGTLAAKAVLRDVGRVMGIPYAKVDRIAKLIPDMTRSLSEAVGSVPALAAEVKNDPEVKQIVDVGSRLEGLTRHASIHAAGVVITPRPTQELVPLYKTSKDEIVTQWDKDVIEDLGLLKMDFLGLKTLTVIDDCIRDLELQGEAPDLDALALDDPETFRLFREGRTSGIFQFESSGMRDLLRRAKPTRFEDLAACNALYRPGALGVGMVEEFISRKHGRRKAQYILPETRPILEETYGVIAYQEQVMQLAVEIAGFSRGEADVLRKAMGKKKPEVMAEQKEKFVSGAAERGVQRRKAEALWEYIEPFAGYGFNKSHSVAYAMLAYKTAFLKAHFPVSFMAAMLTSEMATKDNVAKYLQECRELGIPVLPPDLNESVWAFASVGESIRFGFGAIKGVGESAVEAILASRREVGKYRSLPHFAAELDGKQVNRKVFECLIKSGCFDSFGASRRALAECLDRVLDFAHRRRSEAEVGQGRLFSGEAMPEPRPDPNLEEWPERERLRLEREALGLYLTGNPLSEYKEALASMTSHTTESLRANDSEGPIVVGGIVTRLKQLKIKSGANAGRMMARFILEDPYGAARVTVFADRLQEYGHLLQDEAIVVIRGALRGRGSEAELAVEEVLAFDEDEEVDVGELEVFLGPEVSETEMLRLRDVFAENPGTAPVYLVLQTDDGQVRIRPQKRFHVHLDPELTSKIEAILGKGCIRSTVNLEAPRS